MNPIFDTHAHYGSHQFDDDRHDLIPGLVQQGIVGIVDCGTDYDTSAASLELAHRYPFVYAALGIHPESLIEEDASTRTRFAGDWKTELDAIRPLFADEKAVAVGECGLDYHWPIPKEDQIAMFEAHIRLALELDKPIIVHDRQAHAEVYELLKRYQPRGVVHCFSGSAEDALMLARQGMFIGFGGALTFKGAKRAVKAATALPLEHIVLETDCPYMAPEPCRGQRCDSSLIAHTGAFLAQIRGVEPEVIFESTTQNAKRLFGL